MHEILRIVRIVNKYCGTLFEKIKFYHLYRVCKRDGQCAIYIGD